MQTSDTSPRAPGREAWLRLHPSAHELVLYAEQWVDRDGPLAAMIAAHLHVCPACAREFAAIRQTLALTARAREAEPSRQLTAKILESARRATPAQPPRRPLVLFGKGLATIAALVLTAAGVFYAALPAPTHPTPSLLTPSQFASGNAQRRMLETKPVMGWQNMAREATLLASAITEAPPSSEVDSASDPAARLRHRTASELSAEVQAAVAALERNPGCVRASHIVTVNLPAHVETLRALYLEPSL